MTVCRRRLAARSAHSSCQGDGTVSQQNTIEIVNHILTIHNVQLCKVFTQNRPNGAVFNARRHAIPLYLL